MNTVPHQKEVYLPNFQESKPITMEYIHKGDLILLWISLLVFFNFVLFSCLPLSNCLRNKCQYKLCKPHPYFKDGLPIFKRRCVWWCRHPEWDYKALSHCHPHVLARPQLLWQSPHWVPSGMCCWFWWEAGLAKLEGEGPAQLCCETLTFCSVTLAWSDASFFILMCTLSVYHVKYSISLWQI